MTTPLDAMGGSHLIVTGGTGFVGSAFVRHVIARGANVTLVCRASADHWRLAEVAGKYDRFTADLDALATLGVSLPANTVMVHCAAAGVNQSSDDLADMVATNVAGTANALAFAKRTGVSRFVLVGSSGEYGPGVGLLEDAPLRPTSEYGATRASATMIAQAFGARRGLDVVVVRPFAVFGQFEAAYRLIPHAILSALRGEPIRISSGHQTRDYVHVDNVSIGIARACVAPEARNGVFNLCTGIETTVLDAATIVANLVGSQGGVEAGAMPPIPGEMWRTSGDPAHARSVLGWEPALDFSAGLARTVEWFRQTGRSLPAYAQRH